MNLEKLGNDLLGSVSGFLPGVLGALAVLIIGWFVAGIIRRLVERALHATDLDNKLFKGGASSMSIEKFIAKLVYYLIMLLVLLVVLEMLGVHNVLDPVKDMVSKFLTFIPNILVAGIIGFAGYMIATIASEFMGFASGSLTKVSEKMGFSAEIDLPKLVKQLVFIIVFIPLAIAALDALNISTISDPLKDMLSTFIAVIPKILVAGIILGVFYFGGNYISSMLKTLLSNMGADKLGTKLGIQGMLGNASISDLAGKVAFFFIMFTGTVTALDKLEFGKMTALLNNLLEMAGQIFFGMIIMAVGNFIATMAYDTLAKNKDNAFMASIARIAIMGLFLAIALNTMGIANEIVNLAFGLTLGAVAVAVALSFGLGGREAAGRQMEHILKNFRNEK